MTNSILTYLLSVATQRFETFAAKFPDSGQTTH
jgi:hypothetical protein